MNDAQLLSVVKILLNGIYVLFFIILSILLSFHNRHYILIIITIVLGLATFFGYNYSDFKSKIFKDKESAQFNRTVLESLYNIDSKITNRFRKVEINGESKYVLSFDGIAQGAYYEANNSFKFDNFEIELNVLFRDDKFSNHCVIALSDMTYEPIVSVLRLNSKHKSYPLRVILLLKNIEQNEKQIIVGPEVSKDIWYEIIIKQNFNNTFLIVNGIEYKENTEIFIEKIKNIHIGFSGYKDRLMGFNYLYGDIKFINVFIFKPQKVFAKWSFDPRFICPPESNIINSDESENHRMLLLINEPELIKDVVDEEDLFK